MPYCPSRMFCVSIFSVLESSQPWVLAWPSQKSSVLFLLCHMAIPNSTLGEFASKRIPPCYRGGLPMYHSSFQYTLPLLAWDACPSAHMIFPVSPCR